MKSPCPKCGEELFSRKLVRERSGADNASFLVRFAATTTHCPECGERLVNDPKARALGAMSIVFLALFLVAGRPALAMLFGPDAPGLVALTSVAAYVSLFALLIYSVVAYPYIRGDV